MRQDLRRTKNAGICPYFQYITLRNPLRMVFDSSASYQGQSLNASLLPGPDLTNSLISILTRFRKERIGFIGDIEQMFHSFRIDEKHRNFVRFIWFTDNDPSKPLAEYRMCVHLFGNSSSPAVATYCLRKCIETICEKDVQNSVNRNFYVDDGLASFDSEWEALDLVFRTQHHLKAGGQLRFHKFVSNSPTVMEAIPPEDRSKDLKDIHLDLESAPSQRSLGMNWDLPGDSFVFRFTRKDMPMTKRGVLTFLNSLYDPLGFISPVILAGTFIFRELTYLPLGWDDAIPPDIEILWRSWCSSLCHLQDVQIPSMFVPVSLRNCDRVEVHAFADASEKAVSAVCYIKVFGTEVSYNRFLIGKSKLAPRHGHTVPRLELCAALLAADLVEFIQRHLDAPITDTKLYTDSRLVLGYIYSRTRRFHTYVSNRIHRILSKSTPEQWTHVASDDNPADVGTRSIAANELLDSQWLRGPNRLQEQKAQHLAGRGIYPLVDPDDDVEIRKVIPVSKIDVKHPTWMSRFEKFSTWKALIRLFAFLRSAARRRCGLEPLSDAKSLRSAELFIITQVQSEFYEKEIDRFSKEKSVPKDSPLCRLDPYLDHEGIIRVGGRIHTGDALSGFNGPIVLPRKSYATRLLVEYHHEIVKHQGRHITEGARSICGILGSGCQKIDFHYTHLMCHL